MQAKAMSRNVSRVYDVTNPSATWHVGNTLLCGGVLALPIGKSINYNVQLTNARSNRLANIRIIT